MIYSHFPNGYWHRRLLEAIKEYSFLEKFYVVVEQLEILDPHVLNSPRP